MNYVIALTNMVLSILQAIKNNPEILIVHPVILDSSKKESEEKQNKNQLILDYWIYRYYTKKISPLMKEQVLEYLHKRESERVIE